MQNLTEQLMLINPTIAAAIQQNPWLLPIIALQLILKVIFYPIALYASAKRQSKVWFIVFFIAFLFLNDFAIFPILYLIFLRYNLIKTPASRKNSRKK